MDQMWKIYKQVFAREYHDLIEETEFTSGDARFHLVNAMQDIGGAIEHLAMEVVTDKEIVTRLTEAFKLLT